MALDLAALKAKLAAQKTNGPTTTPTPASNDSSSNTSKSSGQASMDVTVPDAANNNSTASNETSSDVVIPTVNAPAVLGTSKTSEIDHMDFLAKMNQLSEAIHKQHPTMPVLLMQIHKQLRADPELVTTLDEDAIGIVVKGLQIQTKTELVAEVVKKTTSGRGKKNPALDVSML